MKSERANKILKIENLFFIFKDNWITPNVEILINQDNKEFKIIEHKYILDTILVDDYTNMIIPKGHNQTPFIPKKEKQIKRSALKFKQKININDIFFVKYKNYF